MSLRVDKSILEIEVREHKSDAEIVKLNKELGEAGRKYRSLQKEVDKLTDKQKSGQDLTAAETKKLQDLQVQLDQSKTAYQKLDKQKTRYVQKNKLETMTIYELSQEYKQYQMLLKNLDPKSDYYESTQKYLKALKNRMAELNQQALNTKTSLEKFLDRANAFGFAITNALNIKDRIVQWADQYVQAFAKMDDTMTDVMKYTGQTKREAEEMNETFKNMTTRTPREELNALAGTAGRLGIQGRKDIEGFVDAADKINVALGDDLGEGAIDQIGKLTMVFGEDKTKGLNGAMLATGSAINVLGASSSANTGFITEFTSSMAGVAVNAKISQTDIMGYASALSQAGVEGQTASGVFAQLITKMFTDPAKFAKAARLDVKSFTDLLKNDANAAILQFLEGLKQNGGFDSLAPALKSLKMQGTQAVPVISSLINKMDELKKAQDIAKQAYDEGTSIIDEFNNANSSAAAKLEIAQKKLNDVAVELGQKLMPIVEAGISSSTTALKIIDSLISVSAKYAPVIATVTATIAALTIAENANIIAKKLHVFWNEKVIASSSTLWKVLKANPYIAIIGLVSTLAMVMYELFKRTNEVSAAQKALNQIRSDAAAKVGEEESSIHSLIRASKNELLSKEERMKAIDKLQQQIPGYVTELNKETGAYTANKEALDKYLESLSRKYEIEGAKDRLKAIGKELANLRTEQKKAQEVADRARNAGNGYNYTTSWGGTGNTSQDALTHANDKVDRANRALKAKLEERKAIYDTFGLDLQKDAVGSDDNPQSPNNPTDPIDPTGGGSKEDKLRKELEAQAKQAYERELILLRQQYQGKAKQQDEWHDKQFAAEQNYLSKLADIRKKHNASESEMMEVQNKMLDSVATEANRKEEVRKRKQQETLRNLDQYQAEEEIKLARQRLDGEIKTEEEYTNRKLEVEIRYQKMRIGYLKEGSAEYLAAQKQLLQLETQQAQRDKQQREAFDQSYYGVGNETLQKSLKEADRLQEKLDLNKWFRDNDLISEQQYQQNLTAITQQHTEERQQIQEAAYEALNGLMSSASQLFSAMQQQELSRVEARYKKQINAAKKQGRDTTKLEEQMEAEKNEIQKKYAQKQFQMNVLQIIASTATGIARLWKDLPFYAALPLTAVVAASGAMQLASAKAAADQAAGLYTGGYSDEYQEGYTRKGDPKKQAGVIPVHQNEFVANHQAVSNPQLRPVLDVIDRHQKAGDIQMLNATRLLEEAYGQGRYRGGYSGADGTGENGGPVLDTDDETKDLLRRIADNTQDALSVRELRDEIRHQESLEQRARR